MKRAWVLSLPVAVAALAPGCGGDLDGYRQSWSVLPPVALDHSVAYVERASATAYVIDPADPGLRPALTGVGKNAVAAVRRNGQDQLLVLAQGERGESGVAPTDATLTLVPGDRTQPLPTPIKLGARFTALSQSPDGRFVVLHFAPGADSAAGGDVLFNPNQIAVVDLAAAAPMPVPRTLRSFGSVPLDVVFSPELTLPAAGRSLRLGVALSAGYVTLFDLEHGERTEITVSLTLPGDPSMLRPVQVLFEQLDAGKEPTLFVRSEGSSDIVALRLTDVPAAERTDQGNDFRPVLSLLGVGGQPTDMQVFPGGPESKEPRLLVVAPERSAALVIDPATSSTTTIPVGLPASRILLYQGPSPADPTPGPRALLVPLGGVAELGFLDLDQLEEQRTRNLDTRTMGAAASALLPALERGLVIVEHGDAGGLSVVDLGRRTIAPLVTEARASVALGATGSDKLWIVSGDSSRLGYLVLPALAAWEVRLDAPVRAVLPLGPGRDGKRWVVVDHPGSGGRITVLDAAAPGRETARASAGFLYTDLLQRRVP